MSTPWPAVWAQKTPATSTVRPSSTTWRIWLNHQRARSREHGRDPDVTLRRGAAVSAGRVKSSWASFRRREGRRANLDPGNVASFFMPAVLPVSSDIRRPTGPADSGPVGAGRIHPWKGALGPPAFPASPSALPTFSSGRCRLQTGGSHPRNRRGGPLLEELPQRFWKLRRGVAEQFRDGPGITHVILVQHQDLVAIQRRGLAR